MTVEKNNIEELDQQTIESIKNDLIKRKAEITHELNLIANPEKHKVKFPEFGEKADENAQEIENYTTNLATDKVLEHTLRDIESALNRIEKGSYGICKYCNNPIGKKRMLARPVASACIPCKTKLQSN